MVGIKDIAEKAGVSISTVSYALNNNDSKVSKATKEKILSIAEEMNYVPNMAGRALKRRKTNIIGVYISSYKGFFYSSLLEGISEELMKFGYEIIICSGSQTHSFIPERLIDGAIILDRNFSDEEIVKLANQKHPIVVLDREIDSDKVGHILLDNKKGSTEAVRYLVSQSPNNFYIVTGPSKNFDSKKRLAAAKTVLAKANQNYEIFEGDFTKESGFEVAKEFKIQRNKITAVYCLNDEMAIGVYDFLSITDFKIGKDVLIVGYDNIEIAQYITPKLASVDYSMYEWGREAALSLIELLNNKTPRDKTITTKFKINESAIKNDYKT